MPSRQFIQTILHSIPDLIHFMRRPGVNQKRTNKSKAQIAVKTEKSLNLRYAEVMKLRRAILRTQAEIDAASSDNRPAVLK